MGGMNLSAAELGTFPARVLWSSQQLLCKPYYAKYIAGGKEGRSSWSGSKRYSTTT
jgi:hypothetical protein